MIIEAEATVGLVTLPVSSIWDFDPEDPWAFTLSFVDQDAIWVISLDLVNAALSTPEAIHGHADVLTEFVTEEDVLFIHLSNGGKACALKFPASEVQAFMDEADTSNAEMVIGHKLDEFLESL